MGKRRRSRWVYWLGLLILPGLLTSCQRQHGGLSVVGSTSVEPFAEALAEEYMGHHRQEKIFVQGGGSSAGIQAVRTGAAEVGMSSRNLLDSEKDLIAVPIIYDAIAVIVHPGNPLQDLSLEQVRKIFSAEITLWSELGGRNHPITLVTREEGSGTRDAFQKLIMGEKEISLSALVQDSNGAIRQVVTDDRNAVGYISLGLVNDRVKALKIDGIEPRVENIQDHRYKIVRPFLFVFKSNPQGLAKDFLDYILSPPGQKLLVQEGLVSMNTNPESRKGAAR
ncbi:MAG: phosphate ABC transporter substrate-binding protein [Thermodesulfobacteriota bacterium]